jgi:hypothetical protein
MVISDRFLWLHFPKCSGTETERLLKLAFGKDGVTRFDLIDPAHVIWHHSINQRRAYDKSFTTDGRDIICNIRRLPNWLLSRVHYEYVRSPNRRVTRKMLLNGEFYEASGKISNADVYAGLYSNPKVTHWVKTENLVDDLKNVLSKYTDMSGVDLTTEVRRTNVAPIDYIRDVGFYFTENDLKSLYATNPQWAALEREIYGDIFSLP